MRIEFNQKQGRQQLHPNQKYPFRRTIAGGSLRISSVPPNYRGTFQNSHAVPLSLFKPKWLSRGV